MGSQTVSRNKILECFEVLGLDEIPDAETFKTVYRKKCLNNTLIDTQAIILNAGTHLFGGFHNVPQW